MLKHIPAASDNFAIDLGHKVCFGLLLKIFFVLNLAVFWKAIWCIQIMDDTTGSEIIRGIGAQLYTLYFWSPHLMLY
jgi:hypothetical protein